MVFQDVGAGRRLSFDLIFIWIVIKRRFYMGFLCNGEPISDPDLNKSHMDYVNTGSPYEIGEKTYSLWCWNQDKSHMDNIKPWVPSEIDTIMPSRKGNNQDKTQWNHEKRQLNMKSQSLGWKKLNLNYRRDKDPHICLTIRFTRSKLKSVYKR